MDPEYTNYDVDILKTAIVQAEKGYCFIMHSR